MTWLLGKPLLEVFLSLSMRGARTINKYLENLVEGCAAGESKGQRDVICLLALSGSSNRQDPTHRVECTWFASPTRQGHDLVEQRILGPVGEVVQPSVETALRLLDESVGQLCG